MKKEWWILNITVLDLKAVLAVNMTKRTTRHPLPPNGSTHYHLAGTPAKNI